METTFSKALNIFNAGIFSPSKKLIWIIHILLIFSVMACAGNPAMTSNGTQPPPQPSISDTALYAGDEIELKFAFSPEFNETQVIRPDGKIELLLIGEVDVEGKSPSALREELIQSYAKHLAHPELAVIIRSSFRNRVFIGGAVNNPGVLNLMGQMTVLEAIMESGGFDLVSAKVDNVILVRFVDGKRDVYTINFKNALEGENSSPVYLKAMDIVYVPRTTITKVDQWVDQYIWQILPVRFGFTYDLSGNND